MNELILPTLLWVFFIIFAVCKVMEKPDPEQFKLDEDAIIKLMSAHHQCSEECAMCNNTAKAIALAIKDGMATEEK